jgi:peptidyl-prolyl cis-trans isomerase SurA
MKRLSALFLICTVTLFATAQEEGKGKLVESVAGIVGNEVIYLSDIENNVVSLMYNGDKRPINVLRCIVYEDQLNSKLFLDQARIDSIYGSEENVEGALNMRLNDFIRRAGSEKAVEDYFKKSIIEIRRDIKKTLLEQQIIGEVQGNIAGDIKITPNDVKRKYLSIPKDSIPKIPAQVEISVIQVDPPDNDRNKSDARQKLLDLRSRILAGESFSTLSILYSEDTESAKKGGEIGYTTRGDLEKPYADAAFSLSKNSVSKIIETRYGYHIIQLIDRMGEMVNTRHILIRPKVQPDQTIKAMTKLDSLADLIRKDSIKFEKAAMMFSTHKDSRINGGKYVNSDPGSRVYLMNIEELNKDMYVVVRDLKRGEISEPFKTTDENGNTVFRIVRLDNDVPAHIADLKTDYQVLYNLALQEKQIKKYGTWINKKIETTYIKISDEFKSCPFQNKGWLK